MKWKRFLGVAAAGVVATALLAGCSSGSNGMAAGATQGTLTFTMDKADWKPNFETMNALSQKDVKIKLNTVAYAETEQYQAVTKQAFRSGKAPGLFTWNAGQPLDDLIDAGLVADTSSIWANAIANGYATADLEKAYTYKGKQYCVPLNIAYWGMYYNKKTFADAGISVPTTWQELTDDAGKLKANGVTPFFQASDAFPYTTFMNLVEGTDPALYNGLGTDKTKFTDPRIVAVMNQWFDQQKKGYYSPAGTKFDSSVEALKSGQVAMLNIGTWDGASIASAGMTPDQYGFFAVPAVDPSVTPTPVPVETAPLCVSAKSSQEALGLAYSKWWMTPNASAAWTNSHGDVPFNPKVTATDSNLNTLAHTLSGPTYKTTRVIFEIVPPAILTAMKDEFSAFEASPSDPTAVLQKIQDAADTYWASQKK